MPLIYSEKHPEFGRLVLWNMVEHEDFFREKLILPDRVARQIQSWHESRRKEWLAARFILSDFYAISVDETETTELGKVSIPNDSRHISISHSDHLVGVQLANNAVGLDIQFKTDKIHRVASKFCTRNDYDQLGEYYSKEESELLTWSLKESVFKAYGQGKVRYKEEIAIHQLINKNSAILKLSIKDKKERFYMGRLRIIGDFCLTQVMEHPDR